MADADLNVELPTPGEDSAPKRSRSNLIPAIVVAAGLVGGGLFFGMKSHSSAGAATTPGVAATPAKPGDPVDCKAYDIKHEPKKGAVSTPDELSINLESDANGTRHYAKIGVALQLAASVDAKKFNDDNERYRALDVVNRMIVGRNISEFSSPQSFAALKDKVTDQVRPLYDNCKVLGVIFTEFVSQ